MAELDDLREITGEYWVNNRFPRAITDNVRWIGGCSLIFLDEQRPDIVHSSLNAYVVLGSERTIMVDTGHPALWPEFVEKLHDALDGRQLDYVMPTHPEVPHGGALSLLKREFPDLQVVGNPQDYHLYHPEIALEAYRPMSSGEKLSLGDREFEVLEAQFKDLPNTVWGFDHGDAVLFPADGFAFMHWHSQDLCARFASEMKTPLSKDLYEVMTGIVSGVNFRDLSEKFDTFIDLIRRLQPVAIAPAHGSVVHDVSQALHYIEALRDVSLTPWRAEEPGKGSRWDQREADEGEGEASSTARSRTSG